MDQNLARRAFRLLHPATARRLFAAFGQHKIYRVRGHSMRPTLCDGDYVLVDIGERAPEIGSLVVARHPRGEQILIKRIRSKGQASVYLGSDDPNSGTDSRHFGSVPVDRIIGRVRAHLPAARLRAALRRR